MHRRRITPLLAPVLLLLLSASPALADSDSVYVGVYSDQWNAEVDLRNLGVVGEQQVTFGGTFHRPDEGRANTLHILESVWQAQATPVANLEIFSSSERIAAGELDAQITEWATSVQTWLTRGEGRSLLIAPMAEMNGNWVPWGMDPSTYPQAFRRVVQVFRHMGMDETQVRWVWAPNHLASFPYATTSYWPGEEWVDLVGFSTYNFGGEPDEWVSASTALSKAANRMRVVAHDMPFLIMQIASAPDGGQKNEWVVDMVEHVADDPNMIGFIYFNFDKEADWRVWDGLDVSDGWAQAMKLPGVSHQWPMSQWFQPGAIPFDSDTSVSAAPPPGPSIPPPAPPIEPLAAPAFTGAEVSASQFLVTHAGARPE